MLKLVTILACLSTLVRSQQSGGVFYPISFPHPTVFIRHSLPSSSPNFLFQVQHPQPGAVGAVQPNPQLHQAEQSSNQSLRQAVMKKEVSGRVDDTVELIKAKLIEKGFNIFTTVDHAKNAAGVGLELRPSTVIIFGNPNVGTKLMQCAQEYAIDLPQKVLVYEDADGKVWAVINNQLDLANKHGAKGCQALVEKVNGKLGKLLQSF